MVHFCFQSFQKHSIRCKYSSILLVSCQSSAQSVADEPDAASSDSFDDMYAGVDCFDFTASSLICLLAKFDCVRPVVTC